LALLAWATGNSMGGFASSVVSYTPGTGAPSGFNDPAAALGMPAPVVGAGSGYPNVLDPFSPAFGSTEIVAIGTGGQLTLQLDKPITVANAPQLGVISNVGLIDADYPNGLADSSADTFGGGSALVRVSSDGSTWASLGNVNFNLPATYFSKLAGPYETAPGPGDVPADLSKPFTGSIADFAGEDFQQALGTLDGSVGGTWLNLSGTNLATVDYVQFQVPSGYLPIDAITTSAGGASTPEPGSAAFVALAAMGLLLARTRESCIL